MIALFEMPRSKVRDTNLIDTLFVLTTARLCHLTLDRCRCGSKEATVGTASHTSIPHPYCPVRRLCDVEW